MTCAVRFPTAQVNLDANPAIGPNDYLATPDAAYLAPKMSPMLPFLDFDDNGVFDANEKLTWSLNGNSLGDEANLNQGTYSLVVNIPQSALLGFVSARFRWGESGLGPTGPASNS